MTRPGIETRSPGPLTNILPTRPVSQFTAIVEAKITSPAFLFVSRRDKLGVIRKVSDSFILLIPTSLTLCPLRGKLQENLGKKIKRRRCLLNSNFVLGFNNYSVSEIFFQPVDIVASARQGVKIYLSRFWWVMSLWSMVMSGLGQQVRYLASTSGKGRSENGFFFGVNRSILQARTDFASCQRLLEIAIF